VLFGCDPSESLLPHDRRAAVLSAGVSQLNTGVTSTCGVLHHMSARGRGRGRYKWVFGCASNRKTNSP
jgi:hypothetical protein